MSIKGDRVEWMMEILNSVKSSLRGGRKPIHLKKDAGSLMAIP